MDSFDDDVGSNSREILGSVGVSQSSPPTRTSDDNDWQDDNDDMEYEPTTEEESDEMQNFFEQLLEEEEDEEDDDDGDNFEGMFCDLSIIAQFECSLYSDAPEYSTIEVEIDDGGEETERDGTQNITAGKDKLLSILFAPYLMLISTQRGGGRCFAFLPAANSGGCSCPVVVHLTFTGEESGLIPTGFLKFPVMKARG
jgi:hypothetical protein